MWVGLVGIGFALGFLACMMTKRHRGVEIHDHDLLGDDQFHADLELAVKRSAARRRTRERAS